MSKSILGQYCAIELPSLLRWFAPVPEFVAVSVIAVLMAESVDNFTQAHGRGSFDGLLLAVGQEDRETHGCEVGHERVGSAVWYLGLDRSEAMTQGEWREGEGDRTRWKAVQIRAEGVWRQERKNTRCTVP